MNLSSTFFIFITISNHKHPIIAMQSNKPRTMLQIQKDTISKNLINVEKQYIRDLAMKLFPVIPSSQTQICLYMNLKRYIGSMRKKQFPVSMKQIAQDICQKAYSINQNLGKGIYNLMYNQPQFLTRFQTTNNQNSLRNENLSEKKDIIQPNNHIQNQNSRLYSGNQRKQYLSESNTPRMGPIENNNFLDSQSVNSDRYYKNFLQLPFSRQNQPYSPFNNFSNMMSSQPNKNLDLQLNNNYPKTNLTVNNVSQQGSTKNFDNQLQDKNKNINNQNLSIGNTFRNQTQIPKKDTQMIQKSINPQKIVNLIQDPFSSARSIVSPPQKPNNLLQPKTNFVSNTVSSSKTSFYFPPPPSNQPKPSAVNNTVSTGFFGVKKQSTNTNPRKSVVDRYFTDQNSVRNISQTSTCLCQTSCDKIIPNNQQTFYCFHCKNNYHIRCMKRNKNACAICHLRLLIPNKVAHKEVFVGLLKKNKKKHQVYFQLGEQEISYLKSKKDLSFRLQVRCFRLKNQTNNNILFPDSCLIGLNGKQLKQFKPLHKQSSLKYRRDQPISVFKNFQLGQNKLTVTQNHPTNNYGGTQRIEPEDHLIGIYIIQEQTSNATVERIIKNYVTTLQQSKNLLQRNFYINDMNVDNDDEEIISCEVLKIPLTCALTTQKLKYPARGVFCKHFQCFDLRNFIVMTSSSTNPRWVCPICKQSCYEYRIDCIITQILNQYTGCDKVQQLMLYKDGEYQVLDKDEEPIDQKGGKLKNHQPKKIEDLKIVDVLKRQRQQQAERQLLKLQQAQQKKRKKLLTLPSQDLIVNLCSDSD